MFLSLSLSSLSECVYVSLVNVSDCVHVYVSLLLGL